ncbi:hypothetical protein [Nocardioides flavescens]|uniref:Uncharacterized protein n=1 Tax=Nocardioides flavescens TaxID=2691959 RepID=A0A6L7EZT6_9ACTN|nr:hypothetical protein [Nocardioides flavescens]MXG89192.1 hypothetical protein [Nocardioides flavescens]
MAAPLSTPVSPPTSPPMVAIRIVAQYDAPQGEQVRRVDLQLTGSRAVALEDGGATEFETAQLWPFVQELLPPLDVMRADPAGRRAPQQPRRPGEGWAQQCVAAVTIATAAAPQGTATTDPEVVTRSWFATGESTGGEALWSATPTPQGTDVREEPLGALADTLVWDVTGALEVLVRRAEGVAS